MSSDLQNGGMMMHSLDCHHPSTSHLGLTVGLLIFSTVPHHQKELLVGRLDTVQSTTSMFYIKYHLSSRPVIGHLLHVANFWTRNRFNSHSQSI